MPKIYRNFLQGALRMYSVALDRIIAAVNNEEITMEELKERTGLEQKHLDMADDIRANNAYKLARDRYKLAVEAAEASLRAEVIKGNMSESDFKEVTGKSYEITTN